MEPTVVSEQQIMEALHRVPQQQWGQVLEHIHAIQAITDNPSAPLAVGCSLEEKKWTAHELRKLPIEQRNAILSEQAALLEEEYRNNPELTAFEAFGEDDLNVDSSNTETM